MADDKDFLLNLTKASALQLVNSGLTEQVSALHRLQTAQTEGRIVEDMVQRGKDKVARQRTMSLTAQLADAEREIAEMRIAMREWVASQRGVLALAKALREESETCPNHEHHKLGCKGAKAARDKIAEDACDESLTTGEADVAGKTLIPRFVPRHPDRKNRQA